MAKFRQKIFNGPDSGHGSTSGPARGPRRYIKSYKELAQMADGMAKFNKGETQTHLQYKEFCLNRIKTLRGVPI